MSKFCRPRSRRHRRRAPTSSRASSTRRSAPARSRREWSDRGAPSMVIWTSAASTAGPVRLLKNAAIEVGLVEYARAATGAGRGGAAGARARRAPRRRVAGPAAPRAAIAAPVGRVSGAARARHQDPCDEGGPRQSSSVHGHSVTPHPSTGTLKRTRTKPLAPMSAQVTASDPEVPRWTPVSVALGTTHAAWVVAAGPLRR